MLFQSRPLARPFVVAVFWLNAQTENAIISSKSFMVATFIDPSNDKDVKGKPEYVEGPEGKEKQSSLFRVQHHFCSSLL